MAAGGLYLERIYHVTCAECERDENTLDAGTQLMTKSRAAALFKDNGWTRFWGKWLCPECAGLNEYDSQKGQ